MLELDEIIGDPDEVWIWGAPHPADPLDSSRSHRQTRIGPRTPAGLEARLELRSKPQRVMGRWRHELLDVRGRRPRDVGTFRMRYNDQLHLRGGVVQATKADRAEWRITGFLQLQDATDCCDLVTRGGAVVDTVDKPSLVDDLRDLKSTAVKFGSYLMGREDPDADSEVRQRQNAAADALRAALDVPEIVPQELTAFDGWLRARQHHDASGPFPVEAWQVQVDRSRPAPGSLALALVTAATATSHRRLLDNPSEGLLSYLLPPG